MAKAPNTEMCNTEYPIVLVHGIGWKDMKVAEYWYKIPEYLEKRGALVYVTNQDAWNSHRERAPQVAEEISAFIKRHQCEKVNLICHSQGSLDGRWLIEKLNMKNREGELVPAKQLIASYTSIAGVHRGSPLADILTGKLPRKLRPYLERGLNRFATFILNDKNPHAWQAGIELGTEYMRDVFNKECHLIDDKNGGIKDNIYYQSYGTRMRWTAFLSPCPTDHMLTAPWLIIKAIAGENDGQVPVKSMRFGNFRGVTAGYFFSPGVCHWAQINQLLGMVCLFNPRKWIATIVEDLKRMGY
ncbi:MAG: hypothetical protein GY757_52180 [bacterium]|nr:hypothetical protein [bacterium]